MNVTTESIQAILVNHPKLHDGGYGIPKKMGYTENDFSILRSHLLTAESLEAIGRMVAWIETNMEPRDRDNPLHSSYGLKHIAERDGAGYASNGEFIVAALICGYRLGNEFYNPSFNMSQKHITQVERRLMER